MFEMKCPSKTSRTHFVLLHQRNFKKDYISICLMRYMLSHWVPLTIVRKSFNEAPSFEDFCSNFVYFVYEMLVVPLGPTGDCKKTLEGSSIDDLCSSLKYCVHGMHVVPLGPTDDLKRILEGSYIF